MKRTCRTAPPAHNCMIQGFESHLKQTLLTKILTDTAKESPVRSGWKQPASVCQTFCMTTACSLPDLLLITFAQPLNGDLSSQASSLPRCSLLLVPQNTVWVLPSESHASSTAERVTVIPRVGWGMEAEAENSISFSWGQRTNGFVFAPLLKVGEREDMIVKFIRNILKCFYFLNIRVLLGKSFVQLDISVCPPKSWQDISIFLTTSLSGS